MRPVWGCSAAEAVPALTSAHAGTAEAQQPVKMRARTALVVTGTSAQVWRPGSAFCAVLGGERLALVLFAS